MTLTPQHMHFTCTTFAQQKAVVDPNTVFFVLLNSLQTAISEQTEAKITENLTVYFYIISICLSQYVF